MEEQHYCPLCGELEPHYCIEAEVIDITKKYVTVGEYAKMPIEIVRAYHVEREEALKGIIKKHVQTIQNGRYDL